MHKVAMAGPSWRSSEQDFEVGRLFDLDSMKYLCFDGGVYTPCDPEDASIAFDDALSEDPDEWESMARASSDFWGYRLGECSRDLRLPIGVCMDLGYFGPVVCFELVDED